jgi:outer membrane PBP1 activator LpoA protein
MSSPAKRQPIATVLIALLVTACGSQPVPEPDPDTSAPVLTETPGTAPDGESEFSEPLNSVETLLESGQILPAASILRQMDRGKLTPDEQARHSLLWARLYYVEGDADSALASLDHERGAIDKMSPHRRRQFQEYYILLLTATGDTLTAALRANQWLANAEDAQHRAFLINTIWQKIQTSPVEQLQLESESAAANSHWRGWLELGLIAARVADSPDVQVAETQLWQQQYTGHPMAATLPGGLDLLAELASARPLRVALLLPLSSTLSNAAQAVLDGYLSMQYASVQNGWEPQQVLVLDTDEYPDINSAYRAAVDMGASLVIGPLTREALAQWTPPQTPGAIPMLALNWLESQAEESGHLYQLALAPEDEVRQLAQWAFDEGARSALLVRPAGSRGDAVAGAFEERWRQLQGELRSSAVYSSRSDYSSSIKTALNLSESEIRARKIRQLMGEEIEFSPRRRQDIDSVFLLSDQPAEARSIKPLIAFHYAADLPVYSTSQVFSGEPDPQKDRDLNGLRLLQMPWILQEDSLRQTLYNAGAKTSLAAMHALGADAFLLHWRLGQLNANPGNSVRGHTGLLSMDTRGRIHRQLLAATFEDGVPVPLR